MTKEETEMSEAKTGLDRIDAYHIHIYYQGEGRAAAERVSAGVAGEFALEMRPSSGQPNGPHPIPQFRLKFTTAQFASVVPWLMLHREGLDVLVHPLTDNSYEDHTAHAIWLGTPVPLKLDTLSGHYRAEQYPTAHAAG
jgi:aromatic ring-cleaving dioxygenase